ncbi:MAG TPA: hypothetical protein VF855_02925 [Acidimicrobiales bacterium]
MAYPIDPAEPARASSPKMSQADRLGVLSLLMIPCLAVSAVLAAGARWWLLDLRDIDRTEPTADQGLYGWLVVVLVNGVILFAPLWVGVLLGSKGRRLGSRLALGGLVANASLIAGLSALFLFGSL